MVTSTYPVHVDAQLDEQHLSRWQWLVKWVLAIPHYLVLAFLWLAFVVLSVVAFFAILFTGRYPRGIFEFNVGVMRWSWRVAYYAYGALGTDRYPPFTLAERPDYPAHLEVDYPEHLSRGLVLVKWWLLALPHYLVVALFVGGVGYAANGAADDAERAGSSTGLIGLLVLIAAVVLLFTGRYPQAVFDLVLGLNRWVIRVAGYAALMTDQYPPFRLDQGGHDPGGVTTLPAPAPTPGSAQGPGYGPAPGSGPVPPQRPSGWTAGRVVAVVAGSLLLVGSLGLGGGGVTLAVADQTMRDDSGFLMSGGERYTAASYAMVSSSMEVQTAEVAENVPDALLGDVRLTVDPTTDTPVFVGVAETAAVEDYLSGTGHATVVGHDGDGPLYRSTVGGPPATAPTDLDIWAAETSGAGVQELTWSLEDGDWTVVVMNSDGTLGVDAQIAAGAELPALEWMVAGLLIAAGVALVAGLLLVIVPARAASRR